MNSLSTREVNTLSTEIISVCFCLSDEHEHGCGEKAIPGNLRVVSELLVGPEEGNAVHVAVVGDLAVNLIGEEGLYSVVELVLVKVTACIAEEVVGPVGVLNSMDETIKLGNPESVLDGLKVNGRVQGVAGGVHRNHLVSIVTAVLLLGQVL